MKIYLHPEFNRIVPREFFKTHRLNIKGITYAGGSYVNISNKPEFIILAKLLNTIETSSPKDIFGLETALLIVCQQVEYEPATVTVEPRQ